MEHYSFRYDALKIPFLNHALVIKLTINVEIVEKKKT